MKNNLTLFFVAHKMNKGVKKKVIIISIITIMFSIIIIVTSLYKSSKISFDILNNSLDDLRIITVDGDDNISKLKKIQSKLLNNRHVITIDENYKINYLLSYVYQVDSKKTISIYPNYYQLNLVSGQQLQNEFDMICPINAGFGVFDYYTVNDLYNMSKYQNDDLVFTIYKIIYNNKTKESEKIPYNYTFRIVGLYDPTNSYTYGRCYINSSTFNNIVKETTPYFIDNIDDITAIFVDKIENVNVITDILDDNNITYFVSSLINDSMGFYLKISYGLCIVFGLGMIIIINYYLRILISEKNNSFVLQKALGFSKHSIRKIMMLSVTNILLISFCMSLLISFIIKYIYNFTLKRSLEYQLLNIYLSIYPLLLLLLFSIFFSYIYIIIKSNKIYKKSLCEIVYENIN